jgi:hypothetical protein
MGRDMETECQGRGHGQGWGTGQGQGHRQGHRKGKGHFREVSNPWKQLMNSNISAN